MHTYTHTCLTRGGSFLDYTLTVSKRDKTNPHTKTFFIINVSATLKNRQYSFRPKTQSQPAGRLPPLPMWKKAKDPLISFEEDRKRVWLPLRLNNLLIVCKRPHISPISRSKSRGMEEERKCRIQETETGKHKKKRRGRKFFREAKNHLQSVKTFPNRRLNSRSVFLFSRTRTRTRTQRSPTATMSTFTETRPKTCKFRA